MAGEGNRGSTSGLRFNPREAPEFIEQDRTHANGDPREQEKSEQKEIKEKKERQKKMAGLRHIKVKIDQKKPEDEKFDSQEQVGEQAAQTGPPGMSAAFPPGGGLDAPIQTGKPMDFAWDVFTKKTETIESVSSRERGKQSARTKKRGVTTETLRFRSPSIGTTERRRGQGGPLNVQTIHPDKYTGTVMPVRQLVEQGPSLGRRLTLPRYRGLGPAGPKISEADPRRRRAATERSAARRRLPLTRIVAPIPFQTGQPPKPLIEGDESNKKKNTALSEPPTPKTPKKPRTPMGLKTEGQRKLSGAPKSATTPKAPSALAKGPVLSTLANAVFGGLKSAKGLSHADMAEIRSLLNKLKRITKSDAFKKSFYNQKGDAEGPSPNAHPRQTSHPTGATEADPDDDPTMWGAHPIGLLAPRRGHQ